MFDNTGGQHCIRLMFQAKLCFGPRHDPTGETDRQAERQTDRQTQKKRDWQTDRQTGREREIGRETET